MIKENAFERMYLRQYTGQNKIDHAIFRQFLHWLQSTLDNLLSGGRATSVRKIDENKYAIDVQTDDDTVQVNNNKLVAPYDLLQGDNSVIVTARANNTQKVSVRHNGNATETTADGIGLIIHDNGGLIFENHAVRCDYPTDSEIQSIFN